MERVQALQTAEFAAFRHKPPGVGRGVIYAGVAVETDKVYIGQHMHGKRGQSVQSARICEHVGGYGNALLISRACKKHTVKWFVIEWLPEELLNEYEEYWIAELNTMQPNGYNIKPGGNSSGHSEESIAKQRKTKADPEWKKRASESSKRGHQNSTFDHSAENKKRIANAEPAWKIEKAQRYRATIERKREAKLAVASPEEAAKLRSQFARHDRWYHKERATWSMGKV